MHRFVRFLPLDVCPGVAPGQRLKCLLSAIAMLYVMGLGAQSPSPVCPEDRHRELIEALDYAMPAPPSEEELEAAEKWFDWFDFDTSSWRIDLSNRGTLVILLLLLTGLGFFIYRILGDVELRKRVGTAEEEDRINIDDLEEEALVAEGVSLSLLQRAERAGQYDVAVRLRYLQLLKELQDGGLIKYRRDFSNRDYQFQLRATPYLTDFRAITHDYERYWYGKYLIDRLSYRLVSAKFSALTATIKSASQPQLDAD